MKELFPVLFALLLYGGAAFITYWVSRNKGYSGFLFAFLQMIFPCMIIVAFLLPDKSGETKRAEVERRFEESMRKQDREMEALRARIRELEQQQKPAEKASKPAELPKEETRKQSQPVVKSKPVQPNAEQGAEDEKDIQMTYIEGVQAYRMGPNVHDIALASFRRAAEKGHLNAQMYAAQMYYAGEGCRGEPQYDKALYWYERAAEQGQRTAQSNVATMYQKGTGCTVNMEKALYWYEKAGEQGDDDAQLWAGMLYELGQGCTKDTKKARYWYEKSAAQGNEKAKKLLSNMND